jgi:hypothetical protein
MILCYSIGNETKRVTFINGNNSLKNTLAILNRFNTAGLVAPQLPQLPSLPYPPPHLPPLQLSLQPPLPVPPINSNIGKIDLHMFDY